MAGSDWLVPGLPVGASLDTFSERTGETIPYSPFLQVMGHHPQSSQTPLLPALEFSMGCGHCKSTRQRQVAPCPHPVIICPDYSHLNTPLMHPACRVASRATAFMPTQEPSSPVMNRSRWKNTQLPCPSGGMALRCVPCCLPHVPKGTEPQWPAVVTSSQYPFMRRLPFPGSVHHTPDGTSCNHFPNKPLTPETASGGHPSKALATSRGLLRPLSCLQCFWNGVLPASRRKKIILYLSPREENKRGRKVGKKNIL